MLEPEKAKPETEVAKPEVVPRTDCPRKFKLINCTNATKYYTLLGYFTYYYTYMSYVINTLSLNDRNKIYLSVLHLYRKIIHCMQFFMYIPCMYLLITEKMELQLISLHNMQVH